MFVLFFKKRIFMFLLFGSNLGFSRILDSLSSTLWRCSRVWI